MGYAAIRNPRSRVGLMWRPACGFLTMSQPAMLATSKWNAFFLSACVPGTGQLAAGSWTCLGWFAAAGVLVAVFTWLGQLAEGAAWLVPVQFAAGIALSLLRAEHAKRLLEQGVGRQKAVVRSQVACTRRQGRNLEIVIALEVNRSPGELWNVVRDLPRFLTIDPFHDEITLMRDRPAVGVDLVLSHNAFGRRFLRFGRIVAWHEGAGYTFSDLSPRGPRTGFPHVFILEIEPGESPLGQPIRSRLTIRVRGRWTSRLAPVWLGRLWVWLVCREHARLLRKGLFSE